VLGEHLGTAQEARAPSRLLGYLPAVIAADVVGKGLEEPLDDDGVALAEEVGKRPIVADEHVGDEVGDHELHFGGSGSGVRDGALEHEPPEADAGLGGVGREPGERVGGRDVEDELVLERGEHSDHEPSRAAEGERVGPEAAGLELARASADVHGAGTGRGPCAPCSGGEGAEEGAQRVGRGGAWNGDRGRGVEEGGEEGAAAGEEAREGHGVGLGGPGISGAETKGKGVDGRLQQIGLLRTARRTPACRPSSCSRVVSGSSEPTSHQRSLGRRELFAIITVSTLAIVNVPRPTS
jgi:hypothetical protein